MTEAARSFLPLTPGNMRFVEMHILARESAFAVAKRDFVLTTRVPGAAILFDSMVRFESSIDLRLRSVNT